MPGSIKSSRIKWLMVSVCGLSIAVNVGFRRHRSSAGNPSVLWPPYTQLGGQGRLYRFDGYSVVVGPEWSVTESTNIADPEYGEHIVMYDNKSGVRICARPDDSLATAEDARIIVQRNADLLCPIGSAELPETIQHVPAVSIAMDTKHPARHTLQGLADGIMYSEQTTVLAWRGYYMYFTFAYPVGDEVERGRVERVISSLKINEP